MAELDGVTIIVNKLSLDAVVHPFTQKKTKPTEKMVDQETLPPYFCIFLLVALMFWDSSSPELLPSSRKVPVQAEESAQAAAFVHTTGLFMEGRAEATSSLCPHSGAFKGFQWALGRGGGQDSPEGAPVCSTFTIVDGENKNLERRER